MKTTRTIIALALVGVLAACGSGEEAQKAPSAPKRPPMELAPNPPMSKDDIDAIVDAHVSRNAPAASTNQQGEERNKDR